MRILVAGGAGFIGSNLCSALLTAGHFVICVDNMSRGTKENIKALENEKQFCFYQADISMMEQIQEIFEKERPEYIFHLAANSDIQASAKNPEIEYRDTYSTTFWLLQCMREYGVKKLFFASTSAVYGNKHGIVMDEMTPNLSPVSYYGAAKLGSEALISSFSYMNDMKALVFRFPNVIGPHLTHGVIYDFINKLKKDASKLEILGDGKQTKPYIYVNDLIRAILMLMEDLPNGMTVYNLGVDSSTSVTRIADILCDEMGIGNVEYCYTGGVGGWKGDVPEFKYNLDKIHATGWTAEMTSDEAVRKTIRYIFDK
ncbi:MAG: SDR family NAD(P)-dependent oxidoreductase [Lachnospiraceae bacterium]|nr:SDR family NAD(P)-dependent oxidoreductase [Lachnospiraceae bacterium]